MPKPRKGETKKQYLSRYMASSEARRDFPNEKQRYAVANSEWKNKNKK